MPRILVIDDDRAVLSTLKILLESEGFEVLTAENGRLGIEAVQQKMFDAIILDIFMPDMDGFETIRALRDDGSTTPIVALSGAMTLLEDCGRPGSVPNFLAMAEKLGAITTVAKPFRPRDLVDAIRGSMRRAG